MSRPRGGYVGHTPTTNRVVAPGVWTLREAESLRRAAAWPITGDPFFSSVEVLLSMDGANGGTTFTDSSQTPKTITRNGNAQISTAHSQFGGASAFFNGVSDSLSFADILLGTGSFTIEMFFKTGSATQYAQIIGNETSAASSGFTLLINHDTATDGRLFVYRGGSPVLSTSGDDWSDDQWHHLAFVRNASAVALYVDGVSRATGTDTNSYNGAAYHIARNNAFSPRNMIGYIDEVRITKGVARYTAGFTPPTAPFPS